MTGRMDLRLRERLPSWVGRFVWAAFLGALFGATSYAMSLLLGTDPDWGFVGVAYGCGVFTTRCVYDRADA